MLVWGWVVFIGGWVLLLEVVLLLNALGGGFEGSEGRLVVLGRQRIGIGWGWEEIIWRGSCVLFPHFKL